ncbi:hypothetical protein, partial [Serratia marcescens]|uniref:hypothetical protein n=1 Tax=Serratia marcescens TaxID=615 RepID=UPI00281364B6
ESVNKKLDSLMRISDNLNQHNANISKTLGYPDPRLNPMEQAEAARRKAIQDKAQAERHYSSRSGHHRSGHSHRSSQPQDQSASD